MMRVLRQECRAPFGFGLPQPLWMLELGAILIRTETELIIKSRRVVPKRLIDEGYSFAYPDFSDMVAATEEQILKVIQDRAQQKIFEKFSHTCPDI